MKLSQNETSTYIPNHEQNVKCCVYKIEWKLEQPPHTTLPNNFWSPNFKEHQKQLAIPQLEREFRCYWKNISRVWLISYILYLTEELKATTKCLYLRPASHASQLLAAPDDWLADGMLKAWELWEMFPWGNITHNIKFRGSIDDLKVTLHVLIQFSGSFSVFWKDNKTLTSKNIAS